ncbi:MAG: pyruvate formate lyase family protein [Armatimonadota bacterium]
MFDKTAFFAEYNDFYSTYPVDISNLREEWLAKDNADPDMSPFRCKAHLYEVAANGCDVHLFRNSPFYYEIKSGRPKNSWGLSGIGMFMRELRTSEAQRIRSILDPFDAERLMLTWDMIDWDHHCVGYDNVFAHGLLGFRKQAEDRLLGDCDDNQREFLNAVIVAMDSLIHFSNKFADKAESMLLSESDPDVRYRLTRIADTARRVPANPPSTFYEALNTMLFMREACSSLEGLGVSMYGQMDRILEPFYNADLESGRITKDEVKELLQAFLSITDARFDLELAPETSTTVSIGGQYRDGRPVYNELSLLIAEILVDLKLVNPKLNARVSGSHPQEYYELLSTTALSGSNVLAVFNDDTLISAHAGMGKAIEDCRIYANGGCQEPMLQNNEVNFKAYIYVNLLRILELTLYPERVSDADRECFILNDGAPSANTWDAFYNSFMTNLQGVVDGISAIAADAGSKAWLTNPCPMLSATIDDCIGKGMDMMQGGPRYNSSSLALNGFGTLLDSLYAIRHLVYEKSMLSVGDLRRILDEDYSGSEDLREYILKSIPKYGQDDDGVNAFTKKLASDIAVRASGQDNGRGGKFEASLFTYSFFRVWGEQWPATPDGRHAGQFFARGVNPAEYNSRELTAMLNSACSIPMNRFPGGCILDITLPSGIGSRVDIVAAIIRRFVEGGGAILQFSVVDKALLRQARMHPQEYPHLAVRVYGYSAYFTALHESIQDEIIARTEQIC